MLCIYFSLSVQCTLTLLLQLKQTPTDSSYKPSFKKKDRPEPEKQRYKPYSYSAKFRGDRCTYEVDFFLIPLCTVKNISPLTSSVRNSPH